MLRIVCSVNAVCVCVCGGGFKFEVGFVSFLPLFCCEMYILEVHILEMFTVVHQLQHETLKSPLSSP